MNIKDLLKIQQALDLMRQSKVMSQWQAKKYQEKINKLAQDINRG